jgi:hypothetical protein
MIASASALSVEFLVGIEERHSMTQRFADAQSPSAAGAHRLHPAGPAEANHHRQLAESTLPV